MLTLHLLPALRQYWYVITLPTVTLSGLPWEQVGLLVMASNEPGPAWGAARGRVIFMRGRFCDEWVSRTVMVLSSFPLISTSAAVVRLGRHIVR